MEARLIVHGPASGAWNMAADECLLESARHGGPPCLRFYAWEPATLSLGYFQQANDRRVHPSSESIPCVRRTTGGGAIIHDHELTYAFAIGEPPSARRDRLELYNVFHETARDLLAEHRVASRLWTPSEARDVERWDDPFLCFLRRAPGDLVVGRRKVLGSAQRRRFGGLLQHGSLIFGRSSFAPEIDGLAETAAASIDPFEFASRWQRALADRLGLRWSRSDLTSEERERIDRIALGQFGHSDWTGRR